MRDFEDYCWRDLLTDEMAAIFAAYRRDRRVSAQVAVVIVHPPAAFIPRFQPDWNRSSGRIVEEGRRRGLAIVHSVPTGSTPAADLAPHPDERICFRPRESAFLFSDLPAVLTRAKVRGLVICGASTSGALRATTVEAKSFGYHAVIAEEATGDESALLHKLALFDIAHKYADVMSLSELISGLDAAQLER